MKVRIIILLVSLLLFSFLFKIYIQKKHEKNRIGIFTDQNLKSSLESLTNIKIKDTLINVGKQMHMHPVYAIFTIYNMGRNNLRIKEVLPDCHCTISEFDSTEVVPGDSAFITLRYNASNLGAFQSSALVSTNSPNSPTLIFLRGYITENK